LTLAGKGERFARLYEKLYENDYQQRASPRFVTGPFLRLGLTALVAGAVATPTTVRVRRDVIAMGTQLQMDVAAGSRARALAATENAYQAVLQMDSVLSTWHASSLDSLNHASPGSTVTMSPGLATLLGEVMPWRDSTGGAFEPVSGALTDAWDLRGSGRVPSSADLRAALRGTGTAAMTITGGLGVRHRQNAWLDSGAFGKGAALRSAQRALRADGVDAALLDFGGQVLALGAPEGAEGWAVAIADPQDRSRPALRLLLRDVSASTSAQSERFVTVAGARYGHILDPRYGRPVPAWGSVTVIATDPLEADIVSTALFVMGPRQGLAWADRHPELGAIFLVSDASRLRMHASAGAVRFIVHP
jgi:thiamine biosynthesis lipoprotein